MKHDAATGPEKTLSDAEITKFCDHFHRRTGILFSPAKRYFIEKRLLKRMEETGRTDFSKYFTFLRFGAQNDELQELINSMTINETYFFRESHQFDALVESIMEEVSSQRTSSKPVTISSIPCSTGEEPYSIAIKLLEEWPGLEKCDVRILGYDIDTNVLEVAEAGIFSERSINKVPSRYLEKYFSRIANDRYQITGDILDAVDLEPLNVTDPSALRRLPRSDIIFCRNMLIYFDDIVRRQVIDGFYDQLNPGGFLLLGHSESISRTSSLFKVRKFQDCIAYQKEG